MEYNQTFDLLSFGEHFQTTDGKQFIKVRNITEWMGWSVWYQDNYGNKNRFNAMSYDGEPSNINWNEKVATFSKTVLDNSGNSDKISQSTSSTVDDDNGNKNKQIESSKVMKPITYNTLMEAVVAAINELKSAGTLSAYQVTTLIRQKCNQDEWEVSDCVSRPNNANIKFWINHDDVRRAINELYANNELDALGFTGRNFNGTYLEYSFDTAQSLVPTTPTTPSANPTMNVPTAVLSNPTVASKVNEYLTRNLLANSNVTLKQVQSAIKVNGVTCEQLYDIVEVLGYTLTSGALDVDYFSQYTIS